MLFIWNNPNIESLYSSNKIHCIFQPKNFSKKKNSRKESKIKTIIDSSKPNRLFENDKRSEIQISRQFSDQNNATKKNHERKQKQNENYRLFRNHRDPRFKFPAIMKRPPLWQLSRVKYQRVCVTSINLISSICAYLHTEKLAKPLSQLTIGRHSRVNNPSYAVALII